MTSDTGERGSMDREDYAAWSEPTAPREGMSPYPTGGGGVTFERKVAVQYLAHLLTGDGAVELGDGRSVVSVAFQQAPDHPVDDLVIRASRPDESDPCLKLSLGVRRAPNIVQSDESTQKLVRDFVLALMTAPINGPEQRLALVVAGPQQHAEELADLASSAAVQMDAPSFFDLVRTPKKFRQNVVRRLEHVEALVKNALIELGVANPDASRVQQTTWELLARVHVLMPRLETPDETDWAAVQNSLFQVARGTDLTAASSLRDRLAALAAEYAPKAARVDLKILRRDTHALLDATTRRRTKGWAALDHLHQQALASVRGDISATDGARRLRVDRSEATANLLASTVAAPAVVVHGESGVGKSALALTDVTAAAAANPDAVQVLCINLRQIPATTLTLESILGSSFATLLDELSAPQRLLIIDGADAVAEGMLDAFRYLVEAAHRSDVQVIAITASDNKQVVRDALGDRFGPGVAEHAVLGLTDGQIDEVVANFAELRSLAADVRSRELLRRLVVIDLLVRGGVFGVPLSDADAMREVWSGLVRRREQSDRGSPDAREVALLRLAELALTSGQALDVVASLDAAALDGLRRDGLLRTPVDDPFKIGPEFAHDEVRRYAVARVLLGDGDPASKLATLDAPRWSLAAARLACQAFLTLPDAASPLPGRFAKLQAAFDALVSAGHGARWGDVPGEALLTLGDSGPVLADAWSGLRSGEAEGLQRLARLVDQRHRTDGIVNPVVIEPLIDLLLADATPWWSGEYVAELLRDWLQALAVVNTPEGHPLRIHLRERLVAACEAADLRLVEEQEAAAAARAARTPAEIEEERQLRERHRALFTEIGYPRRNRRERPAVPREITDDAVLELFALLGPDLGDEGERILRRVAQDAPWDLAPAVEEFLTGRALASHRLGLLAHLTEAYYLDEDERGSGFHEDGIRDHHWRLGVTPLAAWYRGPFMPLFQSDFRGGVAVLNRMLNHAALARARTLAGLHAMGRPVSDEDLDPYRTQLRVTGEPRVYTGDGHVWIWYRGTGVGPYPCMSALQALERVCDQIIAADVSLATIVAILLEGCESLAMLGLVVGVLVRHLEQAESLLDPFFAEPLVWHHEFNRVVNESSGLAASSEGVVAPERRGWSFRETAMWLVMQADEERAAALRASGDLLVANAGRLVVGSSSDGESDALKSDEIAAHEELAAVRGWASALDHDSYHAFTQDGSTYIQSTPPADVVEVLQRGNEDLHRGQEATRLIVRYHVHPKRGEAEEVPAAELSADIAIARDLLEHPPTLSPGDSWDTPAAVAAVALESHLLRGVALPDEALRFAADTLLRIGEGGAPPRQFEFEGTYFEQGADRSAARAMPLLLLPVAGPLREALDGADGGSAYERARAAGLQLARAIANEVRLHLARGLDRVWSVPCAEGACHHEAGLVLAIETMRDCAFGEWDPKTQARRLVELDDPVGDSLVHTADDGIYFLRLDAAIRALAPAAKADICVSSRARELLMILVAAQRRSLLTYDQDMDHRGTHALVSARALLTIAADGDDAPIHEHIEAYSDNSVLLEGFLRALSAAAEEEPGRSATALRIWPSVITQVLALNDAGHTPFQGNHYGDMALAALMPNPAHEISYFYREVEEQEPIVWWDPLAWQGEIEAWLSVAAGNPSAVDSLIDLVHGLSPEDQVRAGLPWVATAVLADVDRVARRTVLLSSWLIEIRPMAVDTGTLAEWQRVVDALVVAGVTRLAPYSD